MRHIVKIPKRLKIGGFDYRVRVDKRTSSELEADVKWGSHRPTTREILVGTVSPSQQISATFIHECLHAVDSVYMNASLSESQNNSLSSGLHQILEQLGVRFVVK